MKILHIEAGRHLYGGALQVCYLLEGLAKKGVENILVCPVDSEISKAANLFANVETIPIRGELDLLLPLRLSRLIAEHNPDVVHLHSRRGVDIWGGLVAHYHNKPAIITRRVDNRENSLVATLKYGTYDRVVTISEGIRQVLLSEGISPEKVECIHSVVKLEDYQQPRDRDWFESEFDIPSTAPLLGVIAQMIPRKGHRYLLDIAPKLLRLFPNLKIIFFGQGPLRQELEQYVDNHNLNETVFFGGFRTDMPKILPCLDLVVHPALMEGLGVSLLQAAAAGVPIVGAKAGGIPEIVHDGLNGYLVQPGDCEKLYDSIVKLLSDKVLAGTFGAAGRELVMRSFAMETMVNSYCRVYNKLILKTKK